MRKPTPSAEGEFFVRSGVEYNLNVLWLDGTYRLAAIPNLSSAADTTFDISVSDPTAP